MSPALQKEINARRIPWIEWILSSLTGRHQLGIIVVTFIIVGVAALNPSMAWFLGGVIYSILVGGIVVLLSFFLGALLYCAWVYWPWVRDRWSERS